MSIGNAVDRAYSTMHAVEKGNRAMLSPEIQVMIGDIVENLNYRKSDTTDKKIIKISTIIGTFTGGAGGIALGITVHPAFILAGPVVGYGVGLATGHGIVKIKHVIEDKCLIL